MIEEQSIVKVAMADLNVAGPSGILRTTGLGSCVGLTLYDPLTKIGGMAHIMLPSSAIAREGQLNLSKYADTALPILLNKMRNLALLQPVWWPRWPEGPRCLLLPVAGTRCGSVRVMSSPARQV
ncbi:chemotaxis protein CheD [Paenibacillus sp. JCM 10914]|nr:chemotaxis protein CheD [Paenibacillus sp. JCM 10914]